MYVCMYVCMYACMYACMYVYMYVCMYVCMHEESMNHIFLKKGLDLMQSHLLRSIHAVQAVTRYSVYAIGHM